jgi:hypothetical protein
MSTRSQLRADNFFHERAIPEIKHLCELLQKNVSAEVIESVKGQITYKLESKEWWRTMLRFLSRVTDDKVWDEAVETTIYVFHRTKIQREVAAR